MSTPRWDELAATVGDANASRIVAEWLESGIEPLNNAVSLFPRASGFEAGMVQALRMQVTPFIEIFRDRATLYARAAEAMRSERVADAHLRAMDTIEERNRALPPGRKLSAYYGEVPTWDDLPDLDAVDRLERFYVTTDRAQIARGTRDGWERTETP